MPVYNEVRCAIEAKLMAFVGALIHLGRILAGIQTVIELDGSIHDEKEEYDQFRDEEMKLLGLHVLRLKNAELSEMNLVIEKIISYLNTIV